MPLQLYRSSAGSGKTFTLVKFYLVQCFANDNKEYFRHLLALTFTVKAATEMKDRILKTLTGILNNQKEYNDIKLLILHDANILRDNNGLYLLDESLFLKHAKQIHFAILHRYHHFAVYTIDSFFNKVTKSYKYDLNITSNVSISLEDSDYIIKSVKQFIDKIKINDAEADYLLDYLNENFEEDKETNLTKALVKFSKTFLLRSKYQKYLKNIQHVKLDTIISTKSYIKNRLQALVAEIKKHADQCISIIESAGLDANDFYYGKKGIWATLYKIADNKFVLFNTYGNKTIANHEWYSKTKTNQIKNQIDEIKETLLGLCKAIQKHLESNYSEYYILQSINENLYQFGLINLIQAQLNELKQNDNIVFLDDITQYIAQQIIQEPVPYIYLRIGEKYHHLMIDEFQDTSIIQFYNLLPLLVNSLSSNYDNLIVGDIKQSIYRFRNAEMQLIATLPQLIEGIKEMLPFANRELAIQEAEINLSNNLLQVNLQNNYRSATEIVNFNNGFFMYLQSQKPEIKNYYTDVFQINKKKEKGYVEIYFHEKTNDNESHTQQIYQYIKDTINKLTETNTFRKNNIAILCTSNRKVNDIANYLLQQNINVVTQEAMLVQQSKEVMLLLHTLYYIIDRNQLSLAVMVHYFADKYNQKIDYHGLDHSLLLALWDKHNICIDLEILQNENLLTILNTLITVFTLDFTDMYINAFMDAVFQDSAIEPITLYTFCDWVDSKFDKISAQIPEELDAVRIMTIHKSKGLEFPVVIVPFASFKTKPNQTNEEIIFYDTEHITHPVIVKANKNLMNTTFEYLYTKKKEENIIDAINLMYVAFTRAQSHLYIQATRGANASALSHELENYCNITEWLSPTGNNKYTIGDFIIPKVEQYSNVKSRPLLPFIRDDNKNIQVAKQKLLSYDVNDSISRGIAIHKLLSGYALWHHNPEVIDMLCKQNNLEFDADDIKLILTESRLIQYYQYPYMSYDEYELNVDQHTLLRPDYIGLCDNKAVVIEYKTGQPEKQHLQQVEAYKENLSKAGFNDVKSFILYIESKSKFQVV